MEETRNALENFIEKTQPKGKLERNREKMVRHELGLTEIILFHPGNYI
jgi:hypothetical protein